MRSWSLLDHWLGWSDRKTVGTKPCTRPTEIQSWTPQIIIGAPLRVIPKHHWVRPKTKSKHCLHRISVDSAIHSLMLYYVFWIRNKYELALWANVVNQLMSLYLVHLNMAGFKPYQLPLCNDILEIFLAPISQGERNLRV